MLARYFELSRRGATLGGEVRGGLTTFMVMAYIIFVNPAILSFAGIPALRGKPFTYSITNGIGAGFIAYTFLKLVRGQGGKVRPMMYAAAAAFVVYFALPALRRL